MKTKRRVLKHKKRSRPLKEDKLTPLVVEYRRTKDEDALRQLLKESENLIYMVMKWYHMEYFPKMDYYGLVQTCKGEILFRAIKGFKISKGTRFSTYYVWKLKSFIHYKHDCFLRRKKLLEHLSLQQVIYDNGESTPITMEDILTKSHSNTRARTTAELHKIFNIK